MIKYENMTKLELLCAIKGLKETVVANNAEIQTLMKALAEDIEPLEWAVRRIKELEVERTSDQVSEMEKRIKELVGRFQHYFRPDPSMGLKDFCGECALYSTDSIHIRPEPDNE